MQPPQPPAKINLSLMTTVAEPPIRRKALPKKAGAPKPKEAPPPPPPQPAAKPPADDEGAKSSFFLTGVDAEAAGGGGGDDGGGGYRDEELAQAQAEALEHDFWGSADEPFDNSIDIRTALTALKHAVERPPVRWPASSREARSHIRQRRDERPLPRP